MSPRNLSQFKEIRSDKKKLILSTALNLFANKGYHASSVSMIAREAKISKGLMYNYFESKEALLSSIYEEFVEIIMNLMNPDHDDEVTTDEMKDFLSSFFELIEQNKIYWKLYFQLATEKGSFNLFQSEPYSEQFKKTERLINRYFKERFENPEIEKSLFISILKGFALDFLHADENYPQQKIDDFKLRMFELFIK